VSIPALVAGVELARFTLFGSPRTKKNHSRIIKLRGKGGTRVIPSEAHERWFSMVKPQANLIAAKLRAPICEPIAVEALFYRDRAQGDLVGYLQALGDLLEAARIIENDKWIVSWDGSRLMKDAHQPRIEVILTRGKS
jgi:hypothetical protein